MVRIAAVCALAALAALTPTAHAEETVIADGQGAAALSAYGGYLVFSRRDATTGRWALVRWHDGLETPLPLPYRAVPFDADAGPDAAGRPVVDYSRCATDPTTADEWLRARGCRIEELRLDAPAEPRAVPGTHARGSSETTPSRWGAAIAFARHGNRRFASQLRLLRDGARRSVALPGAPVRCLGGCGGRRIRTTVESLDLGARATAFVRRQNGGDTVGIDAEWFLQADPR